MDNPLPIQRVPEDAGYQQGWHYIGSSSDFAAGEAKHIDNFATQVAVWRSHNGDLNALNAYCIHMGADLSIGEVEDDCVRCPFHGWKWDGDGSCVEIPYSKNIPKNAQIRAWCIQEKDGKVYLWFGPKGATPGNNEPFIEN